MNTMDSGSIMEKSEAVCKDLLSKVMKDVSADDIELLEDLKKVYKRTIPFSKRLYVAAYLLKGVLEKGDAPITVRYQTVQHSNKRQGVKDTVYSARPVASSTDKAASPAQPYHAPIQHQAEFSSRSAATEEKRGMPHPKVEIPEDMAVTLFVSIGRGRRVYPRDLVGLFVNAGGIDRERIGDIRVMSNYSFVQIYKDDADTAISKLNGYAYRGKQLSVSYSYNKGADRSAIEPNTPMLQDNLLDEGSLSTTPSTEGTPSTAGIGLSETAAEEAQLSSNGATEPSFSAEGERDNTLDTGSNE